MRDVLRYLIASLVVMAVGAPVNAALAAEPPSGKQDTTAAVQSDSAAPIAEAPSPATLAAAARRIAEGEGLVITDIVVGNGATAMTGAIVRVHYTGWLYDPASADGKGLKFDSSVDRNEPFTFPLGQQRVIRGWDLGVAGMQSGGKRRLLIPADLAYGARGAGGLIPPNATLLFDVELISFRPPM